MKWLLLLSMTVSAWAANITCATTTTNGTWDTAGSWSGSAVPTSADNVTIGSACQIQATGTDAALTLTLNSTGAVPLEISGTLSLNPSADVVNTLVHSQGLLKVDSGGTLTIGNGANNTTNGWVWTAGTLDNSGTINLGVHMAVTSTGNTLWSSHTDSVFNFVGSTAALSVTYSNNTTVSPYPRMTCDAPGNTTGHYCLYQTTSASSAATYGQVLGPSCLFTGCDFRVTGTGFRFLNMSGTAGSPISNMSDLEISQSEFDNVGLVKWAPQEQTAAGNTAIVTNTDFRNGISTTAGEIEFNNSPTKRPSLGPGTRVFAFNTTWTVPSGNGALFLNDDDFDIHDNAFAAKINFQTGTAQRSLFHSNLGTFSDNASASHYFGEAGESNYIYENVWMYPSTCTGGNCHWFNFSNTPHSNGVDFIVRNISDCGNGGYIGYHGNTGPAPKIQRDNLMVNGCGNVDNVAEGINGETVLQGATSLVVHNTMINMNFPGNYSSYSNGISDVEAFASDNAWAGILGNRVSGGIATWNISNVITGTAGWTSQFSVSCNIDTLNPIVIASGSITVPLTGCTGLAVPGRPVTFDAVSKAWWLSGTTLWVTTETDDGTHTTSITSVINTAPFTEIEMLPNAPLAYSANETVSSQAVHVGFALRNNTYDNIFGNCSSNYCGSSAANPNTDSVSYAASNLIWNPTTLQRGTLAVSGLGAGSPNNISMTPQTITSVVTSGGAVISATFGDATHGFQSAQVGDYVLCSGDSAATLAPITAISVGGGCSSTTGPCTLTFNSPSTAFASLGVNGMPTGACTTVGSKTIRAAKQGWVTGAYGDAFKGDRESFAVPKLACSTCTSVTWAKRIDATVSTYADVVKRFMCLNGWDTANPSTRSCTFNPKFNVTSLRNYLYWANESFDQAGKNAYVDGQDAGVRGLTYPAAILQ
jgi:hypothetical protein